MIAIDGISRVFVGDFQKNCIHVYNKEGEFISGQILELKDQKPLAATIGGEPAGAILPLTPKSEIVLSDDDHIYTAFTEHFLIKKYSPDGDYLRAFFYPFERTPVNRDLLQELFPNDHHQNILLNAELPAKWPALHTILIDDLNRIWAATKIDHFDVYEWWVLNENGELLATFTWPRESIIRKIRNGHVYAIENELQEFTKYRIHFESSASF